MCSNSYPLVVHQEADRSPWSELNSDVAELIFARLPEASICRAACVCKRWYSATQMPTFCEFYKKNKIANSCSTFVYRVNGTNHTFVEHSDGFRFRPVEKSYNVPTVSGTEDGDVPIVEAAGGLHLAYTGANLSVLKYKVSLVEKKFRTTPEMPHFVDYPIVGVVDGSLNGSGHKIIVAGGLPMYSEVVEELTVTIYDENTNTWGCCEPLPNEFRSLASSLFMDAVVHEGRFYVYDKFSGSVSWLDVNSKRWSRVIILQPSRKVKHFFLVSRSGALRVVGIEGPSERDVSFTVWSVEDASEETMRVGAIVCSRVFSNTDGAPPSKIQRWKSSSLKVLSAIIRVFLLLVLQFLIHYYKAPERAYCFLQGIMTSCYLKMS